MCSASVHSSKALCFSLCEDEQKFNPVLIYSLDGIFTHAVCLRTFNLVERLFPFKLSEETQKCIAGPWDRSSSNCRSGLTGLCSRLPHLSGLAALYLLQRGCRHPQVHLLPRVLHVPQHRSPFQENRHPQNGRKQQY